MMDRTDADLAARQRLDMLIAQTPGESYSSVSALIGRNHSYIQQYIRRGQPKRLQEADRRKIADYFNVADHELGGPRQDLAPPSGFYEAEHQSLVFVDRYDVRPSAGHGSIVDHDSPCGEVPFRIDHLKSLTPTPPDRLSVLTVKGDSMYPTLADGDEILVDQDERQPHRDAIYVLRLEDALQVKRVSVNPITGRLTIKSDNPLYESWSDCDPQRTDLLGRVIWVGRRL
ncbi:S24 family peptidase [Iodidimonas muriae]|uniref:S24 family peptidase n=1 Tax=Iodidimonas muriae TaxID=261467 RepID=UPI001E45144C|nr:S24 family peptidase [Iodidimonas muriae]